MPNDEIPGYGRQVSMNSVRDKVGFGLMVEVDSTFRFIINDVLQSIHRRGFDDEDQREVEPNIFAMRDKWYSYFVSPVGVCHIQDRAVIAFLSEPDEADIDTVV